MMLASIAVVILETVPRFRVHFHEIFKTVEHDHKDDSHDHDHDVSETPMKKYTQTVASIPLIIVEAITFLFLIIELLLRFIASTHKNRFFCTFLNACDLIALLSQAALLIYLSRYSIFGVQHASLEDTSILIFQAPRIIRIVRIISVARNFIGVHIIMRALRHSRNELILLFMLLATASVFYASILYYVEIHSPHRNIKSIPKGIWWALVTMTLIGYGDYTPVTAGGFIVGGFCSVSGIVIIALPTPVIVNNFSRVSNTAKLCEIIDKREIENSPSQSRRKTWKKVLGSPWATIEEEEVSSSENADSCKSTG